MNRPFSFALSIGLLGASWIGALPAGAWPGPYAGSRIFGGNDVCAVYSESPARTDTDFGVVHYYVGGYEQDYIRAAYPEFHMAGQRETARGLVPVPGERSARGDGASTRRPAGEPEISADAISATTSFVSMIDSSVRIHYRTFANPDGVLTWDIEIHNSGSTPREMAIVPVVRFRQEPVAVRAHAAGGNLFTIASFAHASVVVGFNDDQNISSVSRTSGGFPALRRQLTVGARTIVHARLLLYALPSSERHPSEEQLGDLATARGLWRRWFRSGIHPPLVDTPLLSAYEATLSSLAATSLRGAVPADMTGQFVTEGRPQLYPRDALMTARALAEAGHEEAAEQILRFWNTGIPEKTPGEWYARYDAEARATAGGSGAPFDLPEWDANGYYASLALRLYALTGRRVDDSALLRRLLDFVVAHQDSDGLLSEGGIIEWEGRLPATAMNVAAGLRHGAILAELDGDRASAHRWRSAARRMERGLEKLFSPARGAYMDQRDGREQFNTSANFGFIWGYPDHLELALTNAWYRKNTWRLHNRDAGGVQYFEADGYGSDLFGFTTGASAQYHLVADDASLGLGQVRWMMDRSNEYGMMPERVLSPDGADVSPASPLSWCNGEFAAAVLTAARVGTPGFLAGPDRSGGSEYPWLSLGRDLAALRRVLAGLADAGVEASSTRALAAALTPALAACAAPQAWGSRVAAIQKALNAVERVAAWTEPSRPAPVSARAASRPTAASGWREDVGLLVRSLRPTFDRLAWNLAGLDMEASGPDTAVMGEPHEVRVELSGPSGTRWRKATIEWLDGNRRYRRTVVPARAGSSVVVRVPLEFREGSAPYSASWRVTAEGLVQGQAIRASRTGLVNVRARYASAVQVPSVGAGAPSGDQIITVSTPLASPPERVVLIPPIGWTMTALGRDSAGKSWSWRARPGADLTPGFYKFRFYAFARPGTRGNEETALVVVPHAVSIDLAGSWMFRTGDDSRWAGRVVDTAGWSSILVPKNWEAAGYPDYDGHAWYRSSVNVPAAWRGRDLVVTLGAVDDEDWTYWNGVAIGHTTVWNQKRQYRVPAAAVEAGATNSLAVRVYDGLYGGGLWQGPVQVELAAP